MRRGICSRSKVPSLVTIIYLLGARWRFTMAWGCRFAYLYVGDQRAPEWTANSPAMLCHASQRGRLYKLSIDLSSCCQHPLFQHCLHSRIRLTFAHSFCFIFRRTNSDSCLKTWHLSVYWKLKVELYCFGVFYCYIIYPKLLSLLKPNTPSIPGDPWRWHAVLHLRINIGERKIPIWEDINIHGGRDTNTIQDLVSYSVIVTGFRMDHTSIRIWFQNNQNNILVEAIRKLIPPI